MARGRVNVGGGGLGTFFGDGSDGTTPSLNAITTAPNGGTVANLWDMNAGTTFVTNSLGAGADVVVFQIDFGSPQLLDNIYFWQTSVSANRTFAIQYSDDNVTWTQLGTFAIVTSGSSAQFNFTDRTARYFRFVTTAGTAGTFTCQGLTINYVAGDTQTTKVWRILEPSTLNGGAVVKQYTDYLLPVGYEHTVQNPCQGLVIYSQNDIVVNGIIDMSQKAGLAPNGNAIPMLISKKAYKTAKTSSLLHFDNNITDGNGRVWTNNGGATFDATNKKFGTHAISFNGTNQWIDTPASDDFSFGSEDFTIEAWFRPTSLTGNGYILGNYSNPAVSNTEAFALYRSLDSAGGAYTIGGIYGTIATTTPLIVNTFNHIALVRRNDVVMLFLNGNLENLKNVSGANRRCINKLSVGQRGDNAQYFAGQIDEFRIVKGKAMYTANFTPPTSAYTYQSTYIDEPKTLEKYFQLTNVLQTLRGGYGGNGGYGGGYSGSTGRKTSVGIGGSGRQNLGGFGGGGSGGNLSGGSTSVGVGGSVIFAEIGGGSVRLPHLQSTNGTTGGGVDGLNGSGAIGCYASNGTNIGNTFSGKCFGGGTGGLGSMANSTSASSSDSQYAGGFLVLIAKGDINNSGIIKANGGAGTNGTDAAITTGVGGGGGGGGGGAGGGVVALYYGNAYTNTGTVQVAGGAGGTGGVGTNGGEAGGTGTSGSVGTIHIQKL